MVAPGRVALLRLFVIVLAALGLSALLTSSNGCSVAMLQSLGDRARTQTAEIVTTTHAASGPGEITVLVSCASGYDQKTVVISVPEDTGAWKDARVVARPVIAKEGALADEHVYHRIEIERDGGWEEFAEVDGYSEPSGTGKRIFVSVLMPISVAFDVALAPIYVWGAIFVKFVLPEKPFG